MKIIESDEHYDQCDNCRKSVSPRVELDYRHGYDGATVWICEECLRTALALLDAAKTGAK